MEVLQKITDQAILEPKLVNNIKGAFIIPSYQRGYRWEKEHITMLLNDVYENGDKNYSLQPVVVKKTSENTYELIDGQQRTTSLYLILQYMQTILPFIELNFSLQYETRVKSEAFLKNPNPEEANDNIDFFHIYNAYIAIKYWFEDSTTNDKSLKAINLYKYFGERVKVIWYEVNTTEDSIALFTRLNIGKIPLTNAELVKALFLAKDESTITEEKQLEISTSWDMIEKAMQNDSLWYFLTNQSPEKHATRIELIFNLMANKPLDEKEQFFTFFYFNTLMKTTPKVDIWKEIQSYFLILQEWFQKKDIYHKVGYLVAVGTSMQSIINNAKGLTKRAFEAELNKAITEALNLTHDAVLELSYDKNKDKPIIEKVLLLHNVETTRLLKDNSLKYAFDKHKKSRWSLEHIHAQQSEGLNKKEDQKEWLVLHKKSLEQLVLQNPNTIEITALIQKIEVNLETITKEIFDQIFYEVVSMLSEDEDRSYINLLPNMALLSSANNAALNNATFDVKRNRILEIDKAGAYIPIATRRVFLKYYTASQDHQLHFWGEQDRKAYVDNMIGENGLLTPYLKQEPIND